MPRMRLPFPAALGLDRASGTMVVQQSAGNDLRDMVILNGRLRVRGGLGTALSTLASRTDICHLAYFRARAKIVAVTYDNVTRNVYIATFDLSGYSATNVTTWGTLSAGTVDPPRFSTAEAYSFIFLAHDEPDVTKRLATQYYDGTTVTTLTANLDNTAAQNVQFRGVASDDTYMFGWGFGSNSDKARPEVVRISRADDPRQWPANGYFIAGVRDDPVLAVRPCAAGKMVLKSSSRHLIIGNDKATFGIRPLDYNHGVASGRLAVTVGQEVYAWTLEGPKVSDGGEYQPLELPLDLQAALPSGLPTGTRLDQGHCYYDPEAKFVEWMFPDPTANVTLGFTLSLRDDPSKGQFGYRLYPMVIRSVVSIAPAIESAVSSPGFASAVSCSGVQTGSTFQIKASWTHNSTVGDETVEIWGRQGAAAYTLLSSFAINVSAGTQSKQFAVAAAGSWDLAIRYTRAGLYATGYTASDPATWTAGSRGTGTVTALPALTPSAPSITYAGTLAAATWTASWSAVVAGAVTDVYATVSGHPYEVIVPIVNLLVGTSAANGTSLASISPTQNGDTIHGRTLQIAVVQRLTVNGIAGFSPTSALSTGTFVGLTEAPTAITVSNVVASVTGNTQFDVAWTNSASFGSATTKLSEVNGLMAVNGLGNSGSAFSASGGLSPVTAVTPISAYRCSTKGLGAQLTGSVYVRQRYVIGGLEKYTQWAGVPASLSAVCQS